MTRKLTYKDYMSLFFVGATTAREMLAKDRKILKEKRLTARCIMPRYGLQSADLAPILSGNVR